MARRNDDGEVKRRWIVAVVLAGLIVVFGPRPRPEADARRLARVAEAAAAGRPESALAALEAALRFEPALASLHVAAARFAAQAADPARAAEHLAAAPPTARQTLGDTCLETWARQATHGIAAVDYGILCSGTAPDQPRWEASILTDAEMARAIEELEAWLAANPEDLSAWEALAGLTALTDAEALQDVVLRAYRVFPLGSATLDGLLRLAPARQPGLAPAERAARIGELFAAQERWALAGTSLEQALAREASFPRAMALLGLAQTRLGLDGLPRVTQAAATAPTDPVVRFLVGQYWLSRGDSETAARQLAYARSLDPADPGITAALAAALAASGRYAEAAEAYLEAARSEGTDASFWLLLAEFSVRNEFQVEELGLPAARNAVALAEDAPSFSALGLALHLAGDPRSGERALQRSLALDPADPGAWYRYGLILLDLGRAPEARRALAAARSLDSHGTIGELARRSLESAGAP